MSGACDAGSLAGTLLDWQRRCGRHGLPWQGSRDPYRVWLSEIMLQQTQVATVLTYYPRFLERFPDVAALAAAPADEVLALWAGLGYYSRARNLHRCAQAVVAQHGGAFPRSASALAELPGIGRSTAAAIAAFCFGERAAILDGNVKRVLTRVWGHGEDLAVARHEKALWALAEAELPPDPADMPAYTQGLMDLGATVCTPRRPRCGDCPWAARCVALAEGQPTAYPVRTRRLKRGSRDWTLLWLLRGDRVWLVPRPARGVWAGLWTLPVCETPQAVQALREDLQATPGQTHLLPSFTHVLTHLDLTLRPVVHRLPSDLAALPHWLPQAQEGRWVSPDGLAALGLPAPVQRLLQQGAAPRLD